MKLSIVIPLFNEKDNIGLLVRDIYEKLNKTEFELTIVDDSSNDGTIEVLKNLERKYKDIKIIYRKDQPRDLSKSCQEGFENSKYDNILVMDGDLQHDPIYIPEMINEFEKYYAVTDDKFNNKDFESKVLKNNRLITKGIEVGHIFQLGTKYSEAMKAGVLSESGKNQVMTMGCYGIGVSRIVAAAIEQNNDDYGIIWPQSIAPFDLAIVPMNMHKSHRIPDIANNLYQGLKDAGLDVLFDDRKERPGVMFNDMELMGVPYTLVIGERNLDENKVELKNRRTGEKLMVDLDTAIETIKAAVKG